MSWLLRTLLLWVLVFGIRVTAAEPRTLTVVLDNKYPPYSFLTEDGQLQGVLIDQWRLFEKRTGFRVTLRGLDWAEVLNQMKEGKADVIDTCFDTQERRAWLDFLPPHARIEVPICFHESVEGVSDLRSIRSFEVGAKRGDANAGLLELAGVEHIRLYNSYEDIIRAAEKGELKLFVVDKPAALYFLNRAGIAQHFRFTQPVSVGEFHRAIHHGDSRLLSLLQGGFAMISPEEYRAIDEKWFGMPVGKTTMIVTLLTIAGLAVLVLAAVLAIWNQTLRWQVGRRTAALQQSEEHLRRTLEHLPVALGIAGLNGRIEYVNLEFTRLFGFEARDLPDIATWTRLAYPDPGYRQIQLTQWTEDCGLAIRQGRPTPVRLYRITAKDGTLRETEVVMNPIGDLFITTFMDVTERRRLNEQLLQSQKMEAVGMLAGGLAHDFNNILASVLLHVGLLRGEETNPSTRYSLLEIEGEIGRAAELTRQLLTFSRKKSFTLAPLRLLDLLAGGNLLFRRLLGETIRVELSHGEHVPNVLGHAGSLEQAIMNLALNARDAMPSGGLLRIVIGEPFTVDTWQEMRPGVQPGTFVRLSVSDTGIGMDEDTLKRIFDPFFTTKEVGHGTGLGLAIVFAIVKQHGGWIEVESKPGHGSSFHLHLQVTELAPEPTRKPSQGERPQGKGGETILVVEDEPAVRRMLEASLQRLGYRVLTAANPAQALELWDKTTTAFSLLITDMIMPGGRTGLDLARELTSRSPGLKVIISSGYEKALEGMDCEFTRLPKPYSTEDLAQLVRRSLDAG
jgi:PAS domain S-box-containing protein